ncbi:MAG TPA: DUF6163 family protein [Bauldia sp.]|nr:DUF6163 family protein [Bauldia sp.]
MTSKDVMAPVVLPRTRLEIILDQYVVALSVVVLLFGLRQWAIILGALPGAGGPFEDMSTPWFVVTIHMAVVDLVAAVGLWLRVAGGKVLWVYSALFEITLHTVFTGTFGIDWLVVGFHAATLTVFVVLTILVWRQPRR